MAGYQGDGPTGPFTELEAALGSWKVKFVRYDGERINMYAGTYRVGVIITASDPNTYAFAQTTFNLYYQITPAKYDLAGLKWDYDPVGSPSTYPFTFDNTAKSVKLVGTFPTGLSVKNYKVGTYDTVFRWKS